MNNERMHSLGIQQDEYAYTSVISASSNAGSFNTVIQARQVFNKMPLKDLVSWNEILSQYVNARDEPADVDCDDIWFSTKWLWRRRFEAIQSDELEEFSNLMAITLHLNRLSSMVHNDSTAYVGDSSNLGCKAEKLEELCIFLS
ncbi:hypothetical protein VNO77_16459 [Canavalia gladiata]|uniref:Pentatricopeptide repeat-containing protein n=1 Tax=Canavalia gladiata TaxID=3824 RepID=A0AAN9M5W3_CANGL